MLASMKCVVLNVIYMVELQCRMLEIFAHISIIISFGPHREVVAYDPSSTYLELMIGFSLSVIRCS